MVLGDLDSYMQKKKKKKEIDHQLTPYTKINLKMGKRLKYKSQHHKIPRGKYKQENLRYSMQQYFHQYVP